MPAVTWAIRLVVCLAVHGCTSASGGAVELSWKLRTASGADQSFVDCDATGKLTDPNGNLFEGTGPLTDIRLQWQVGDRSGSADFPCFDNHGVTTFEVPSGQAQLSVEPICANDVPASMQTFIAPAPDQRTVIVGDTVSLGAVEIVVQVSSCNLQACICQ
jgi:hypothetical protein